MEAGDAITGVLMTAAGIGLVGLGYLVGRWRVLIAVAVVIAVPLILSDVLYFGADVDLPGYCGEPKCDPGPIPMSIMLLFLPAILGLTALGVLGRRRRG